MKMRLKCRFLAAIARVLEAVVTLDLPRTPEQLGAAQSQISVYENSLSLFLPLACQRYALRRGESRRYIENKGSSGDVDENK
jgi:hypothetical protein